MINNFKLFHGNVITTQYILFWLLLLLYTDIGGYQGGFFGNNVYGQINFKDLFIALISIVFILSNKADYSTKLKKILITAIVVWILYYIFIFGFLNNNSSTFVNFLIKNRILFYNVLIAYYVASYINKNSKVFFIVLVYSSILIFFLFAITLLSGLELIPIWYGKRGFIEADRNFLFSYSLMPWLIPIAIIITIFKFNIPEKKLIIIAGSFMLILWVLSLTRRHLLFTLIFLIIYTFLAYKLNYIKYVFTFRSISIFVIPILFLLIFQASYLNYANIVFQETLKIITTGESSIGVSETRLKLNKDFILTEFSNRPLLGTGFDNNWRIKEGDDLGYEASDYPFLSALAMQGVLGIMFFIPIYIFIYRWLYSQYKRLKIFGAINLFPTKYDFILYLFLLGSFSLHILTYMNYFEVVSNATSVLSTNFFIQVGILLGLNQRILLYHNKKRFNFK